MTAALAKFPAEEALRSAHRRTLRKLEQAKASKAELVQAVFDAAKEACATLQIPPVPRPEKDTRQRTGETAIAVLSDWQLAKRTPTYNSDVCERRIAQYAEKVSLLTKIMRADHPVREARVYLLGDLVEGEMIFPGQSHLIDASLYSQVLERGPYILAAFLRRLLSDFERVHVVGVIGNHGAIGGRARREYHPESNADAMLYAVTRLVTKAEEDEGRLTWAPTVARGERLWYALDTVGEKRFFLFHGDQIKGGFAGWPWYAFARKLQGWKDLYGFDYSLSGHFHTPVRFKVGRLIHWGNGTTESTNNYAAEMLAAHGVPSQWLLYCHPKHGITAEYEAFL